MYNISYRMYFFKSYLPNAAKLKLPRKQRTILPILPEVHTQFFSLFFFCLPVHRIYLPCSNHRSIIIRAQRWRWWQRIGGVGILLFVFSRFPSPISPVSSLYLYTLDRILFLSPIANVGILWYTVPQLSLFCLLPYLPSTTKPRLQP